uniref:TFIIS N-terminal domain-containing protein n=1 Tax=Oryza rufipogon TaxID=4529 RepID=A0A0E0QXK6_ORYRU
MAGGEAESAVREMVRSMGAEQLDEAISFATMELAGRDIPFEDMFRLCDEQELRRAKKPAMAVISGSGEEVERIKSKLEIGEDGSPTSNSSEKTVVELLRALQTVPMTVPDAGGEQDRQDDQRPEEALVGAGSRRRRRPRLPLHSPRPIAPRRQTRRPAAQKPAPTAPPKKTASNKREEAPALVDEAKLAVAKRKLQEGYEDAASAKKQRMIQVIDAPRKKVKNWRPVAVVEPRRRIAPAVAAAPPLRMCRAA